MKELSIEQKAERYDKVVNEVKNLRDVLLKEGIINKDGVICNNFNRIFPELVESENERIRKELIHYLQDAALYKAPMYKGAVYSAEEAVAWLEKQAEQKLNPILDIDIPFGAKDSELQEASYYIPEGFHAEIEGNRVVIKRGEQKPVELSNEDEKIKKALFKYFTTSDNNAYYEVCGVATKKILVWLDKQMKQKSTCGKEDE